MSEIIDVKKENTRPCLICYPRDTRGNGKWQKAFFHFWWRTKDACGEETLYAIVEMQEGTVMRIPSCYMRFIDRDKSEFEVSSEDDGMEAK